MRLEEKEKYIKWYRIAQKVVNDETMIPNITDEQIVSLVSKEDWLIFALLGEGKKEDAYSRNDPSIYISLLNGKMRVGLFFNTVNSIEKIKNILTGIHQEERKKLSTLFQKLDDEYETSLSRKIKAYNYAQVPEYKDIMNIKTNTLDEDFIKNMFEQAVRIREEGQEKFQSAKVNGKYYFESPTIELVGVTINQNENEFKKRISEIKEIFSVCSSVKTDSELNKYVKNLSKNIEKLESDEKELIKMKRVGINKNIIGLDERLNATRKKLEKLRKDKEILLNDI